MSIITGWRSLNAFLIHLVMIFLGALLFAGSFPSLFFENGLPFLAWIAYIPMFWLIRRIPFKTSFFWGALYGYVAYRLFNYWLSDFHPLASLIVEVIYLVYFTFLFPLLKLAAILFPQRGYILQWILWIGFEYLRTQGFLGYSYGIIGYSQWQIIPVIQIADIFGVWGVSGLVLFPGVWLAAALQDSISQDTPFNGNFFRKIRAFFLREWISVALWVIALTGTLVYGFSASIDYSNAPTVRIALIQHNTDPWRGNLEEYRNNYEVLKRLSQEALQQEPKPDLVVWSETAFVPRIYWHINYRGDPDSYILVKELMDYLAAQEVPFVIGNDDARKEPAKNPDPREDYRVDYNAVMLVEGGQITEQYRKLHLVPFTEHFPYKKQFPQIYGALKNADTHFWEKGNEATVFKLKEIKFSTPICFEDTFGCLSRNFVQKGAELLINLSNDAWSNSLPAQMQHLSMAVFRAVENRRFMVRSTSSGQTCGIDPNGHIMAMAEPFVETQLTVQVPLITADALTNSFYTKYGDFLPHVCIGAVCILLIIGVILNILKVSEKEITAD